MPLRIPSPYLLFLGDVSLAGLAKTAHGLVEWAPERCLAQFSLPGCAAEAGLPELSPIEAARRGARAMVVGVAPQGGALPESWWPALVDALEQGLDLVSGMHARLSDVPLLRDTAQRLGRRLFDVRHTDRAIPSATNRRRSGRRVLTVGLDCSVGKKYAALALTRVLRNRGVEATFRATGQTGILIAGEGIAVDAITADFVAGAAELLSPDAAAAHWDVIEGQGSLYHPAYAGVTLGLLHGSQPDALVLCGHATRKGLELMPDVPLRDYPEAIAAHEHLAAVTHPAPRVVALSVNTQGLATDHEARGHLDALADRVGLPATDPLRFGAEPLADAVLARPLR